MRCEIKGSMDKDICNPQIADIDVLLQTHPIESIITNGATAHALLHKYYPQFDAVCLALPSTSPANARLNKALWIDALRKMTQTETL